MHGPVLLPSKARTATTHSEDVRSTVGDSGVLLILNITEAPESEDTLELRIQAKDVTSGSYVTLAGSTSEAGSALGEGATLAYMLYPGASEAIDFVNLEVIAIPVPRHWRALVDHSGEGSWTYSLGYQPLS